MKKLSKKQQELFDAITDQDVEHIGYSSWYGNGSEGGKIAAGAEINITFAKPKEWEGRLCRSVSFRGRTVDALVNRGLIRNVKGTASTQRNTKRGWTVFIYSCRMELTEKGKGF